MVKNRFLLLLGIVLLLLSATPAFSADHRVVRVGAFNYYPGIFRDTDGRVKGFYVDALEELGRRENIRFEYVYGSWNEGLERIKNGDLDVLTSVAYTPERAQFMDYAETPLLTVWGELYAPRNSTIDRIQDVRGKTVGVMAGDFNGKSFIQLVNKFHIPCRFVEFPAFDDVFKAVAAGNVDAGVVNSTFGTSRKSAYRVQSTGVIFNPFDIFFTVAKGKNGDLLTLLDTNLERWRSDPASVYNVARQKWTHDEQIVYLIPAWAKYSALAFILLIAGGTFFILLLRSQVRRKTEEIVKREASLRESETRYRSIFENDYLPMMVIDPENGGIVDANPASVSFYGWSRERLRELTIGDLYPPGMDEILTEPDQPESREGNHLFSRHQLANGTVRDVEVFTGPITVGGKTQLFSTIRDITQQKLYEKELLDKNAELERFTYTVSHDLKSPLITIQFFTGQVMHDLAAGQHVNVQDDLKKVTDAAAKMNMLLNDLLDLSRIGSVKNPSVIIELPLLLDEIVAQMQGPINQGGVDVRIEPGLPAVQGDPQRVAELFQNLIENAIKYMGQQPTPRIDIGVRRDGGEQVFFIADNGIGIDPRFNENIFGLFNKLDAKSKGTGVGLALVKRIVETHGGRVWVESTGAGKGSTFCFTLPVAGTCT